MKTSEMISLMRGFFSDYLHYRKDLKKQDEWIKKYAQKKGYKFNPHWMFYTNLKIWIAESEKTFGSRYCPCFEPGENSEFNRTLLCPCKYVEEEIQKHGTCHCVLFGSGELTDDKFKEAEARLMNEYRGVPLKMSGGVLDTRGMPPDPLRNLPIPDSLHQVKRALGKFKGKHLEVIVGTKTEAENLRSFAKLKGFGYESREQDGSIRVILTP